MTAAQYAALLGLWIAGIISPGPDVLLILRNAFLTTRGKAMLTAVGVMIGNLMWITLSLTGVTLVINSNHVLKLVIQIAGALFLARMGYGSLRAGLATRALHRAGTGSTPPGDPAAAAGTIGGPAFSKAGGLLGTRNLTAGKALLQGTITNLANAKAIVFFIALFATVVPADILWWEGLIALALLMAVGLAWFLAVAWFGSVPALARRFQARSAEVEIVAGVVFLLVAVLLLVEVLVVG
ncbi:amino acid transporter [Kocuria marina]|uniref:Amino acid transporter n=1 Tax=Kocuria marina TaxID=223184 RepID=A0A0B0DBP0_9MICC|nr:LysE family translocator [Kocuria marina]KHE75386.1 amino acid transporter [Kocuria marina]